MDLEHTTTRPHIKLANISRYMNSTSVNATLSLSLTSISTTKSEFLMHDIRAIDDSIDSSIDIHDKDE